MRAFSQSSRQLLLLGILACFALCVQGKAKPWGESGEEQDELDGWWSDEKEDSKPPVAPANVDHSAHNHDSRNNQQESGGSVNSWGSSGGSGGSNLAAFNESCGLPPKKSCASAHLLQCSSTDGYGICVCQPQYTYVRPTEKCWPIAKLEQNTCDYDAQCHAGVWGGVSRCHKNDQKCECFDYSSNGRRNTTQINGVCYIRKLVGDLCASDEECDKTIPGDAYCKPEEGRQVNAYSNGTCDCRDTHMFWKASESCLKLSTTINETCLVTEQCTKGTLGRFSRCSPETAMCECYTKRNGTDVVYYGKLAQCFLRKEYNDTCETDDECRASLGPDVECGNTNPEMPDEKVCHCPKGRVCRSSAYSIFFAGPSYTSALGLASTAAAMLVSSMTSGTGLTSSG